MPGGRDGGWLLAGIPFDGEPAGDNVKTIAVASGLQNIESFYRECRRIVGATRVNFRIAKRVSSFGVVAG